MTNKIIYILLLQVTISLTARAQLPSFLPGYELVFYDEFDSIFSNTQIDSSKWNRIPEWNQSGTRTGNVGSCINRFGYDNSPPVYWERAYENKYWTDTNNIKVSNGTCKLISERDSGFMGAVWNWIPCSDSLCTGYPCDSASQTCFREDTIPFNYTTGVLYSRERFKYGYFEIKFKLPPPPAAPYNYGGFGPNFWLFNATPPVNWWSEIDIFEINAFNAKTGHINHFTSNVHYSNKDSLVHPSSFFELGNITDNVWHTASAWWTPDFIKIFFDDNLIHTVQDVPGLSVDSLIEMPIVVNINTPASNFCTNYDSLIKFPYIYEIDYIRVYQLKQEFHTGKVYKDFSIDNSSQDYFDVIDYDLSQFSDRLIFPQNFSPPPSAWLRKFRYK